MKKAIMAGASSGIVAGMILMGTSSTVLAETSDISAPAYTQNTSTVGMHLTHRWNSVGKAGVLAGGFGLDKEKVKKELRAGKTMKQILRENGIVLSHADNGYRHKGRKI